MKKVVRFFTDGKRYGFPPKIERALAYVFTPMAAIVGLMVLTGTAHATMLDNLGNYMYGGMTGPFAKGSATGLLVLTSIGMHKLEGRAHQMAAGGVVASGGVLAAPLVITEASNALTGAVLIAANYLHMFRF